MNPRTDTLLLILLALISASADAAEYVREGGRWQTKAGKTDPGKETVLVKMNAASAAQDAGEVGRAADIWERLAENETDSESAGRALVELARIRLHEGRLDDASELIERISAKHSAFSRFDEAVQVQFDIGAAYAAGEKRRLGGWLPWFKDRGAAFKEWDKAVKLAPNGPLADEALIRSARLALTLDDSGRADEALDRLVSDYPSSKHLPEALELLARIRSAESLGAAWDQAASVASAEHWRTIIEQFPSDPRAKAAAEQVRALRDRTARSRLLLAQFYWKNRNNPDAARRMADACRTVAPESAAAKEAEALIAEMERQGEPPRTFADTVLGPYPRPRKISETKPTAVEGVDSLGFRRDDARPAIDNERR
ncbi:MAG: outer membrane protein assembly factor BamD [Opitutales bacterium]